MTLKNTVLGILCFVNALPAMAWTPVTSCDGNTLEIDQDGKSNSYQLVLRGNVSDWLVNQTHLVASFSNSSNEVVQQETANSQFGAYRYYELFDGKNDGLAVKVSLENYPPRLEAQTYNAKYADYGPLQTYYFNNCQM